jgi:hypothetical protein
MLESKFYASFGFLMICVRVNVPTSPSFSFAVSIIVGGTITRFWLPILAVKVRFHVSISTTITQYHQLII